MRRLPSIALGVVIFLLLSLPGRAQIYQPSDQDSADNPGGSAITGGRTFFFIRGTVRDSATGQVFVNVTVDLTSLGGRLLASTQSNNSGNFGFDNLPRGTYVVKVQLNEYQTFTQRVDIDIVSEIDVQALLHRNSERDDPPPGRAPTVSARELTIPEKAREPMEKGMRLLMKPDYSGSIREFQKAIQAYPNYYEAYAEMGVAYMGMKDSPHAEAALHKSLDLSNQKYPEACVMLAKLFSDGQRFADAEPMARKGLDLDANSWKADVELGRALLGEGRVDEAEKSVQAAVKIQPNTPELYLLLTDIHIKLRNAGALLDDLNMYLKLAPLGPAAEQVRALRDKVRRSMANAPANP